MFGFYRTKRFIARKERLTRRFITKEERRLHKIEAALEAVMMTGLLTGARVLEETTAGFLALVYLAFLLIKDDNDNSKKLKTT